MHLGLCAPETGRKSLLMWRIERFIPTQCPLKYVTYFDPSWLPNKQYTDTTVLPPQNFVRKAHFITIMLDY